MKPKKIAEVGIFCEGLDGVLVRKSVSRSWVEETASYLYGYNYGLATAIKYLISQLKKVGISVDREKP